MGKRVAPKPVLLTGFTPKSTSTQGVTLSTKGGQVEVTVLAPNLIRLRATRQAHFPAGSFAVVQTDWPEVPTKVRQRKRDIELRTDQFAFRLDKAKGTWRVTDNRGWPVLASATPISHSKKDGWRLGLTLKAHDRIWGLGETTGPMDKRGLTREFWNIDVLGHASCIHPSLKNLYVSIPLGLIWSEGRASGVFWDNPGKQVWDMGVTREDTLQMHATTGELDLYLFLGPSLPQIVERFTELTGRMTLPPKWALGYQQSRYGYPTRQHIEKVAHNFRKKEIPCDVLHFDIMHMDGYRVFTFGKTYPQPAQLIRKLARKGFKVVTIVDPGVKTDRKFGVYQRGRKQKAFVRDPQGKDIVGKVWPGKSVFPDFFQANVQQWWGKEQRALTKLGVTGIWNDMNEPSSFDLPGKTLPLDAQHVTEHGTVAHEQVHNVYGQKMAQASSEGLLASAPEQRPFVITRAGYAGIQRNAMVWTGDNSSTWFHLGESIPMLLNLSLSGVPFCGADAGGFLEDVTGELLVRWMQLAAFTPFFRNHTNNESRDQEPWTFGKDAEEICKRYIQTRYQLLPYLYCLFAEAQRHGTPIMRPLAWHAPGDAVAAACNDEFLLGENLLIAPVIQQGAVARSVYLPRGTWFSFWDGQAFDGGQHIIAHAPLNTLPVFVRAGTILPYGPVQQYVGQHEEPFQTLHIWPGALGSLEYYEDDGVSNAYQQGQYHRRRLAVKPIGGTTEISIGASEGNYQSRFQGWRVMVHQQARKPRLYINDRRIDMYYEETWGLAMIDLPMVPQGIRMVMK